VRQTVHEIPKFLKRDIKNYRYGIMTLLAPGFSLGTTSTSTNEPAAMIMSLGRYQLSSFSFRSNTRVLACCWRRFPVFAPVVWLFYLSCFVYVACRGPTFWPLTMFISSPNIINVSFLLSASIPDMACAC
jgi:hypothetical protein